METAGSLTKIEVPSTSLVELVHMRFTAVFAAVICAATMALVPRLARAEDATWLKTLHRAYVGYTFGDGTIKTLRYAETAAKRDGKPIESRHVVRSGLAYRENEHSVKENFDTSNGFTGNIFWYSDQNGFTTPVADASTGIMYASDLVFTDAIAVLPWTYRDTVTEDGLKVAIARTELKNGPTVDLHVDTATGAYHKVIIDPAGDYERRLRVLKYAEVGAGVRAISSWQDEGEDPVTFTRDAFEVNPLVSDSDLHPPVQTARWDFGPTGIVPFTTPHHRVIVSATINGVLGTFMVDSGAAEIYLSGNFARRAGLRPSGHSEAYSLYGVEKTDIGKVDTLQLGDATLRDVVVNFGTKEFDTDGSDGMLGYGLFAGADVTVDFKTNTLKLRDPVVATATASDSGTHVKGSFADGQPKIPMVLDKSVLFDAIVDTGNPSVVLIPSQQLGRHGLRFYANNGGSECGHIDTLAVGTISYERPRACLMLAQSRWLLLGMDFLKQFDRVDFDYPNGELVFYPKPK